MSQAAARIEARRGLLGLSVGQAAMASCMAKNGNSIAKKLRRALMQLIFGDRKNG